MLSTCMNCAEMSLDIPVNKRKQTIWQKLRMPTIYSIASIIALEAHKIIRKLRLRDVRTTIQTIVQMHVRFAVV